VDRPVPRHTAPVTAVELFTVGHGTLTAAQLGRLLHEAGIALLVDVRSYPGSRRNPQFGRAEMATWVPDAGVEYRWEPRLGGRRPTSPGSPNVALRNEAFRGYADHMAGPEFRVALAEVLAGAAERRTAVMCSESVWWRCHRRLLADALLVRGWEVRHILAAGRAAEHELTPFAQVEAGRLTYPPRQLSLGA
jgi:uncharacterized protein (DUF488 family)